MSEVVTTTDQMVELFGGVFGSHGLVVKVDEERRHVTAVVRERFEVRFALEPEHGMFSIAVVIGPTASTTTFFGKPPLLDPREQYVREMMQRVHEWTTLRIAPAGR
ncbi:hypothetical protein ON058_02895 [Demequina sp. B12]|uniref:hypothetical protein n=1 Tax=Demequina sp. B12 TaxID=2992757 RepID=UPI00237C4354|nr:hypothetical protein [Demequina sp. B12]MDE0572358.1 hypothetical protein [Demequina sp. B12]